MTLSRAPALSEPPLLPGSASPVHGRQDHSPGRGLRSSAYTGGGCGLPLIQLLTHLALSWESSRYVRTWGQGACVSEGIPPLLRILSPRQHPSAPQHQRHEGAPLPAPARPPAAPPLAPGLPGGAGRVRAAAPPARSPFGRAGRTGTPLCRLALLFTLRKTFSLLPFRQALPGPEGGEGPKER